MGLKDWINIQYFGKGSRLVKATGEGWQSRMDGVLKQYIAKRSRGASSDA
jgi:hypothetical protein